MGKFGRGTDSVGSLYEGSDCHAFSGVGGEGLDLRAVEGEDKFSRFEGFEELEVAHGEDRTGFAEIDDGFADAASFANHFHSESGLAGKVLAAFEFQPTYRKRKFGVLVLRGFRGPDLDGPP